MSYRGLSELRQVPRGKAVTADHCTSEVLEKTASTAMQGNKEKGVPAKVKLLLDMSRPFSSRTRLLFIMSGTWRTGATLTFKASGYDQSTDLCPVENILPIVKEELSKLLRQLREHLPRQLSKQLREDRAPERANGMTGCQGLNFR